MKNILFCFSIALAILLPTPVNALNHTSTVKVKTGYVLHSFILKQAGNDIHFFNDAVLDLSNDVDLDDAERKKTAVEKQSFNKTSFVVQDFFYNYAKIISSDTYFITSSTSIFIFISQFRL